MVDLEDVLCHLHRNGIELALSREGVWRCWRWCCQLIKVSIQTDWLAMLDNAFAELVLAAHEHFLENIHHPCPRF